MATVVHKETAIPFGSPDAGQPLTPDEFEAADFERGYRYEWIKGILVVTPASLEEERDG